MSRWSRVQEAVERVTGVAVRPTATVDRLEEAELELRGKQRELQDLAYTVLNYTGGNPQDLKAQERRNLVQRARVIWQQDPQFGGQVKLLNDFVLGRGIPKPQAVDEDVQRAIDRFWDDPDNARVLTSHEAQVRFNTDLTIQSNVFPLVYDDGDDGAVKLGLLDHDTVEEAVEDPDKRLATLWYFTKSYRKVWDPEKHGYKVSREREQIKYYEEFRNLRDAKRDQRDGLRKEDLPQIRPEHMGRGRVLHVAINRTLEQKFGIPEIARTIRWLTAYNDLMRARVDMAKAAASIIGKRKIKGGAAAMQQMAHNAMLAAGVSATGQVADPTALAQHPRPGALIDENDLVQTEAFRFSSGGSESESDQKGIRSQLAVGGGWPDPYIGGEGGNLSTATQLELRVLKMVEARQQVLEDVIRTLVMRAIERAVEVGLLDRFRPMTAEEREREVKKAEEDATAGAVAGPSPQAQEARRRHRHDRDERQLRLVAEEAPDDEDAPVGHLWATPMEDELDVPEGYVLRELDFTVSMPSPLRRAMTDLVSAIGNIAKTFDPNATNLELSRLLLGIALGEALEVEDPGSAVERIFPEGYVDPAVAAAMGAPVNAEGMPAIPAGDFTEGDPTSTGADGQQHGEDNPYGAAQRARPPEEVMQQALLEAFSDTRVITLHSRDGEAMPKAVQEAVVRRALERARRVAPTTTGRKAAAAYGADRGSESDVMADELLGPAVSKALALVAAGS